MTKEFVPYEGSPSGMSTTRALFPYYYRFCQDEHKFEIYEGNHRLGLFASPIIYATDGLFVDTSGNFYDGLKKIWTLEKKVLPFEIVGAYRCYGQIFIIHVHSESIFVSCEHACMELSFSHFLGIRNDSLWLLAKTSLGHSISVMRGLQIIKSFEVKHPQYVGLSKTKCLYLTEGHLHHIDTSTLEKGTSIRKFTSKTLLASETCDFIMTFGSKGAQLEDIDGHTGFGHEVPLNDEMPTCFFILGKTLVLGFKKTIGVITLS